MVMRELLPHVVDMPLSLGDHLHELRKRLIMPLIALGGFFILAVSMQSRLKLLLVAPLQRTIEILGPETAAKLGLPSDGSPALLQPFALGESAMVSMQIAFETALVLSFPILIYELWKFITVGLKEQERRLGFLFIPFGIILFYVGGLLGYFYGLPYFYAWLMQWQADDPAARAATLLGMQLYHDFFVNMTICFGLVMDIPWLVMVLVRTGVVTVQRFAKWRRYVVFANVILAAMITPTQDLFSLAAMFLPMQLLFEIGLIASRICFRKQVAEAAAAEAAAAAAPAAASPFTANYVPPAWEPPVAEHPPYEHPPYDEHDGHAPFTPAHDPALGPEPTGEGRALDGATSGLAAVDPDRHADLQPPAAPAPPAPAAPVDALYAPDPAPLATTDVTPRPAATDRDPAAPEESTGA